MNADLTSKNVQTSIENNSCPISRRFYPVKAQIATKSAKIVMMERKEHVFARYNV